MSIETNKEIVRRFFYQAYDHQNFATACGMLSRNYSLHDPSVPEFAGGPEAWRQMSIAVRQAMPDLRVTIEDQIAEADLVVTRWMACGTQLGELAGIPATGKHVLFTGITVSRIVGEKIAEQWQEWDRAGMLQQLGVAEELSLAR
jgi:steroid delta-isomerase-like uncharacterized protein